MRMRQVRLVSLLWNGLFWGTLSLYLLQGTGCVSDLKPASTPEVLPEPEPLDSLDVPIDKVAVCVYEKVGLRREPGNRKTTSEGENNYIVTILYGEKVEMLLDTPTVESGGRTYMYVKLLDGKEGWVHDYVFEKHGRLAVMTEDAEIHRRPDPMTLRDDKFKRGEIVVVIENADKPSPYDDEWLHVSYRDKKKKGYIQRKNVLSFAKQDVQVALLFYKARQERNPQRRLERLQEVAARDIAQGSRVRTFILEAIEELKSETDPNYAPPSNDRPELSDKLYITVNDTWLYNEPSEQGGEGITRLSEGMVCTVLDRGERMSLEDISDYWYQVRYEDIEGWVFGYYTSERLLE